MSRHSLDSSSTKIRKHSSVPALLGEKLFKSPQASFASQKNPPMKDLLYTSIHAKSPFTYFWKKIKLVWSWW